MYLSKLIQVLRSFNQQQMLQLRKYIHSPYFKVYAPARELFDYLYRAYPDFEPQKISFKKIAAKTNSLHLPHTQERAGVKLMRSVEDFMMQEEWSKNETGNKRYQLKAYKEQDFENEFVKGYKKEMQRLDESPEQDIDTFFNRHLLTELSLTGFQAKLNRTTQNDIMPIVETLDAFYAIKKLRYLCEALNRKRFFGIPMGRHEKDIPNLLEILAPYSNENYPYVFLFVNVCKMMQSECYEDFDLYYQLIKQAANQSGATQPVSEAMAYAINQCLVWFNKGFDRAANEYLWGIDWKMKHHLLLENGKLTPITFRNIITLSVANGAAPKTIEKLIAIYSVHLPAEYQETYLAFARGMHCYAQRKYIEAIRFFLTAEAKEDAKFNVTLRRWQWVCSYECDPNDIANLHSQFDALEKYMERHREELKPVAKVFVRFIQYASLLLKSGAAGIEEVDFIRLKNEDHFVGKPWLLEKFVLKKQKTRAQGARVKATIRRS